MSSARPLYRLAASASRQARPLQRQTRSLFSPAAPSRTLQPLASRRIQWPSSRSFSVSAFKSHGHITPPKPGEELWVTFIDKDGDEHKIAVSAGDNLLDIAQDNDLEMEGACGGSCACSTCHVIVVDEEHYDKMPEPEDDENDMLDLAFGLTETSRLGCQVTMTKELDGLRVKLPSMTRNLQASDFS
ncbi:2fe-2s iron-sulfur cluster binding domain protein [Colletotrichum truncatum]|uniref:2fe-2s iron-sulfur cluster binding domain protein n=1 Tax=Colletotrichum truncatum TaxID=5467 RepID=A0ACC3ZGK5_COLTU|nr:2fe-2s iron-sulfur cluster binding domain protein [Colletotrichum truncatum]KAF6784714.1 2fe-2s iron-sulfur cluster binding domain protein [Colletotrichum truncatum]